MCKNDHMHPSDVKEGKIELIADCDGLLKVDREKLKKVNSLGEMMIATRHGDTYVKKGDKLAGTRIIPLVIKKEKMETAQAVCSDGPILTLKPFHKKKFAVLTTGNEVYYHRIEDTFTPVIQEKLAEFGAEMIFHEVYDDDASKITDGCRRSKIPEHASFPTARRCCREPCSFWRMPKTEHRSSACRDASCIRNGRFLILSCRASLQLMRCKRMSGPVLARAVSA